MYWHITNEWDAQMQLYYFVVDFNEHFSCVLNSESCVVLLMRLYFFKFRK